MEFRIEQNDVVLDGFAAFAEQVKRDYRVGITIVREEDLVFRFTCPRSVAQVVGKAKAALVDWLAIRGVRQYLAELISGLDASTGVLAKEAPRLEPLVHHIRSVS